MTNLETVADRLMSTIENTGRVKLDPGACDRIRLWCAGRGRDGAPLATILTTRLGRIAGEHLVRKIRTKGDRIREFSSGGVLRAGGVRRLEADLWSGTILCPPKPLPDPDPDPDPPDPDPPGAVHVAG